MTRSLTRQILWPTTFVLFGTALLLALGVWQLQRLEWKEGLLAEIEARTTAQPVDLKQAIRLADDGKDVNYLRVRVEGSFQHDKERYLYGIADGKPGWHVITPLKSSDGDVVLVDRGFVPDELKDPAKRQAGELQGTVAVTGLVRLPETKSMFMPANQPAQNLWFWRDLDGMTQSMFPTGTQAVAPFYLELEKSDVPGGWPEGGQTRLALPNNHLQYAITWFCLAIGLLAVYGVYLRGLLARKPG